MKNIFSTLLVIVILGASAVGTVLLYQRAFEKVVVDEAPTPGEATREISTRLVEPFTKAWATRDVEILKSLTPVEFGGGLPVLVDWTITSLPPFESNTRSTSDELKRQSTTDFDVFFGYLLDRMFGLTNVQTFFQISETESYAEKRLPDSWSFKLMLGASGINEHGGVVTYRSDQWVVVVIPDENDARLAAFRDWQILGETLLETDEPVVERVLGVLALQGIEAGVEAIVSLDAADFDGDDDLDIALQFEDGQRFVFSQTGDDYEDVTESLGISVNVENRESPSRTIWFDLDEDGRPDLIFGDQVFKNKDGTTFENVTGRFDVNEMLGPAGANSMNELIEHFRSE